MDTAWYSTREPPTLSTELIDQTGHGRAQVAADEHHAVAGGRGLVDPGCEQSLGLVPRSRPEHITFPNHRAGEAIGVVEMLE